jgi:hypothetical protein
MGTFIVSTWVVAGALVADASSTIEQAERLLAEGRLAQAEEQLRPVVADAAVRRQDAELHERALVALGEAVDREARSAEDSARALLDGGDPRRAASAYEQAANIRRRSPYLTLDCLAAFPASNENPSHLHAFLHRVEATLYNETLARAAFAWWLAGDEAANAAVLDLPASHPAVLEPDPVDDLAVRRLAYSARLAELGAALFRQNEFDPASRAYAAAKSERLAALRGKADDEWAREQLNCALAEFNARRPARAVELLRELQRTLPRYRPEMVAQELEDALRATAR